MATNDSSVDKNPEEEAKAEETNSKCENSGVTIAKLKKALMQRIPIKSRKRLTKAAAIKIQKKSRLQLLQSIYQYIHSQSQERMLILQYTSCSSMRNFEMAHSHAMP